MIASPPPTYDEYRRAREAYTLAIQPFILLHARVQMLCPLAVIVKDDGTVEDCSEAIRPQWAKDQIRKIDALVEELRNHYFSRFETNPPPTRSRRATN